MRHRYIITRTIINKVINYDKSFFFDNFYEFECKDCGDKIVSYRKNEDEFGNGLYCSEKLVKDIIE